MQIFIIFGFFVVMGETAVVAQNAEQLEMMQQQQLEVMKKFQQQQLEMMKKQMELNKKNGTKFGMPPTMGAPYMPPTAPGMPPTMGAPFGMPEQFKKNFKSEENATAPTNPLPPVTASEILEDKKKSLDSKFDRARELMECTKRLAKQRKGDGWAPWSPSRLPELKCCTDKNRNNVICQRYYQ